MDEILNLYLIAPVGYEDRSSVIVAPDDSIAKQKAKTYPPIKELTDMGVQLVALDISTGLATQGYSILVSKLGMFH